MINKSLNPPISMIHPQTDNTTERYNWPQDLQGVILSSFHWGNLFSQIPGGILVQKYGGKKSFLTSAFASAIVVALIPVSVKMGECESFDIQLNSLNFHMLYKML